MPSTLPRPRRTPGRILPALALLLLCACNRSVTLPPLVEEPGAPQIPGKFVWHNLITNDGEAARRFYAGLFGWEYEVKDDGRYSVIRYQGRNLGGILDTSEDENAPEAGRWLSAISVVSLEQSLAAVERAGGKQLEAPVEVPGVGRVVTVEDADGAILHLLSSDHGDPPDVDPPLHDWLWHELLANRPQRALDFYAGAFGYGVKPLRKNPSSDYRVLWSAGDARAGVLQNPFEKTHSTWIPYVRVEDPGALAERAAALGGRIIIRPRADLRDGTLALIVDPSGAPVALQKWSPEEVRP